MSTESSPTQSASPPCAGSALFATTEHDFPIGPGDNDNYRNRCWNCGAEFNGHKHQPTCKVCHDAWEAKWNAMTNAEQKAYMHERLRAAEQWFEAQEKKPTVITTDPAEMAAIYAKPSTQSREDAIRSIIKQNNNAVPTAGGSNQSPKLPK